jgi:hypothetical protein
MTCVCFVFFLLNLGQIAGLQSPYNGIGLLSLSAIRENSFLRRSEKPGLPRALISHPIGCRDLSTAPGRLSGVLVYSTDLFLNLQKGIKTPLHLAKPR